jgi:hypothetical protein
MFLSRLVQRDLPIGDAAVAAAVAFAGAGTLALQYFKKGPADDESGKFLLVVLII